MTSRFLSIVSAYFTSPFGQPGCNEINNTFLFFFAGAGTLDEQRSYTSEGYQMLLEKVEDLKDGENAWYYEVQGYHEFTVWSTEIFIALQMLFS